MAAQLDDDGAECYGDAFCDCPACLEDAAILAGYEADQIRGEVR